MTERQSSEKRSLSNVAKVARAELERIAARGDHEELTFLVSQNDEQHELVLPATAVHLLMEVLEQLTQNKSVSVVANDKMLTTQEAASILQVSRPYVTKLLLENKLTYQMVGTHRRVRYDDVIAYKADIDTERANTLDELAADGQDIGVGY
ncbi:MAG: excisionase family DNA-binding protein [Pseudomonadota bacterium]